MIGHCPCQATGGANALNEEVETADVIKVSCQHDFKTERATIVEV